MTLEPKEKSNLVRTILRLSVAGAIAVVGFLSGGYVARNYLDYNSLSKFIKENELVYGKDLNCVVALEQNQRLSEYDLSYGARKAVRDYLKTCGGKNAI